MTHTWRSVPSRSAPFFDPGQTGIVIGDGASKEKLICLIQVKPGSSLANSVFGMGWVRPLLLIALALASWAQVAGACVEPQATQPSTQAETPAPMPAHRGQGGHELRTCECLPAMAAGLRTPLGESDKLIAAGSAGTDPQLSIGRRARAGARLAPHFVEAPPSHSLYLTTARLRL